MGSIEDSSGVPQVWQRRSEGSGTSHNAFSGNFWGDGRSSFRRYLVDGMSHVRLRQQSGALELDRRSSPSLEFRNSINGVQNSIDGVRNSIDGVQNSINGVRNSIDGVRNSIIGVSISIAGVRT